MQRGLNEREMEMRMMVVGDYYDELHHDVDELPSKLHASRDVHHAQLAVDVDEDLLLVGNDDGREHARDLGGR